LKNIKLTRVTHHLIEKHLGKNPVIGLLSNNEANGFWAMSYSLIDTKKKFTLNIQGTIQRLVCKEIFWRLVDKRVYV